MTKKIITKIVIDMPTGKVLEQHSYDYAGPIAHCKGASDQQVELEKQQADFYSSLKDSFAAEFAGQEAILKSLDTAMEPILKAGPNQYGFSLEEDRALKGQAIDQTAENFAKSERSLQNSIAARGGGNVFLPSGAEAQLKEETYNAAAKTKSDALRQITEKGYEEGRNNWLSAAATLGKTAATYNPSGVSNSATNAGNSAAAEENKITEENNAANPWSIAAGVIGGGVSALAGNPAIGNFFSKGKSG